MQIWTAWKYQNKKETEKRKQNTYTQKKKTIKKKTTEKIPPKTTKQSKNLRIVFIFCIDQVRKLYTAIPLKDIFFWITWIINFNE